MNNTPISERVRISFFGKRNAGKSSIINAVSNQELAIVSDIPGTTTDPVSKSMEILPLGPVVLTDTAGIDDEGVLGTLRVEKTIEVLNKTDIAIVVADVSSDDFNIEKELILKIKERNIPVLLVATKSDAGVLSDSLNQLSKELDVRLISTSALKKDGIWELKEALGHMRPHAHKEITLLEGLAQKGDVVLLVTPIDDSAPKGRMILPQVMALRDIMDKEAICVCCQHEQYEETLAALVALPKLVVTDSQVFPYVSERTPKDLFLTSFSILMARYKGDLAEFVDGANAIDNLKDGDIVLIAEACTHHEQKNDIGKVQIPKKLSEFTGKKLIFEKISGNTFPSDISKYALIIHCGACMITRTQMVYRQSYAKGKDIPVTNYGVLLAKLINILDDSVKGLI